MSCAIALWFMPFPLGSGAATIPRENTRASRTAPTVTMGTPVSLPIEGIARQLWASAAPDEPERIIACTFENDVAHAQGPSAVYVSLDGGNTWMRTLRDTSSLWVSETACAAGPDGRTFFVASASNTSHGGQSHSTGSMEAFQSLDGGLTWRGPGRYPFVDWMSLVVNGQETYLFGNNMANGLGDAGRGGWLNRRGLMMVSRDGLRYSSPLFPVVDGDSETTGLYPISSVATSDGGVLTLFAQLAEHGREVSYFIYRAFGKEYRALARITVPAEIHANALNGQMAIDRSGRFRDRVYLVLPAVAGDRNVLLLGTSDDSGKTWKATAWLQGNRVAPVPERRSTFAGVAVNRDGILGVEWLPPGGCPVFFVSVDGGSSIAKQVHLGGCEEGKDREAATGSLEDHLWTLNTDLFRQAGERGPGFSMMIDPSAQWGVQIAADAAGHFHVFWDEFKENGGIRLLTASVSVEEEPIAPAAPVDLGNLGDLSQQTIMNVARQSFDPSTATLATDVTIASRDEVIAYPSLLEVVAEHSDCGKAVYLNPSARSEDGRVLYKIPKDPSRQRLMPQEQTLPVHIEVQLTGCESSTGSLLTAARKITEKGKTLFSPFSVRFHILGGSLRLP